MLKKELSTANRAAKTAGNILIQMFGQINYIKKKGEIDLVTGADLKAEESILKMIHSEFPRDNILSEESGKHREVSDRTWIVDPLDGTTNFAHTFPFFAVSIALEVEREMVLGVVFDPHMGEHYEAVKGMGAFLNNKPLKVSKTRDLKESLLATGFPYYIHKKPQRLMALFEKMIVLTQGVRRPGSAAIDLCYVAAGRVDGFWEEGLEPWDTAAGCVIVSEAGGRLSTFEDTPYTPYSKNIVASNGFIHEQMLKTINK